MPRLVCVLLLCALCHPALAATDIRCIAGEEGLITLDGLLGEWRDIEGTGLDEAKQITLGRESWSGPKDLSVLVSCLRTERYLYLAFDVTDDYLVRMKEAKPGEDHVMVHFASGRTVHSLLIYPSDLKQVPRKLRGSARLVKAAKVAEALQTRGYSVEVQLPLRAIPGFAARAVAIRGGVAVADCDSRVRGKTETMISSSSGHSKAAGLGRFSFANVDDTVTHFLKSQGLSSRDVVFDKSAEMGGDPGLERVIRAGPFIAIFGEEYHFLKLNVQSRSDISDFKLLDLAGDGKHSVVVKTIERGGGGARQILHIFKLVGPGIHRLFAAEIAKEMGARRLVSKVAFVRTRKKRIELVITAGKPVGWTAQTYREAPAQDVIPILLPWSKQTKARYRFSGDEFVEVK